MKKVLFILLSMFLLTACSDSENKEITMSRDEIPQETIDAITSIVLDDVRGINSSCSECRCTIKTKNIKGDGSVVYSFTCSSGNNYWATFCNGDVLIIEQYSNSGYQQLPIPCN